MTQNTLDKQLAERIQKLLTEAHLCDPSALQSLLAVRVGCNSKLQGHHSIKTHDGTVDLLGILNGLCGADSEDVGPVRALRIDGALIGFDVYCKPVDVGAVVEEPRKSTSPELSANDARRLPSPVTRSIEMDMAVSRTKHASRPKTSRALHMWSDASMALLSLYQRGIIGSDYKAVLEPGDDCISISYNDTQNKCSHCVKVSTTPTARELMNYSKQQIMQACESLLGAADSKPRASVDVGATLEAMVATIKAENPSIPAATLRSMVMNAVVDEMGELRRAHLVSAYYVESNLRNSLTVKYAHSPDDVMRSVEVQLPEIPVDPAEKEFGRSIQDEARLRARERSSTVNVGIVEGIVVDMVLRGLIHPTDWSLWGLDDGKVAAKYISVSDGEEFDHRVEGMKWSRVARSREAWERVVQYVMARGIQDLVARSPGPDYLKMAICLAEAGMANLVARGDIRNYKVSVHRHRDVQPILLPSDCGDMKSFSVGSILTDIICEFDVGGMPVGLNGPILYKSIVRLQ